MTDLQAIKRFLVDEVSSRFEPFGLTPGKTACQFLGGTDALRHVFQVTVTIDKGRGVIHVSPEIGVRNRKIEDIFHRHSEFNAKQQTETVTVGGPVSILVNDPSFDLIVDHPTAAEAAVHRVVEAYNDVASSYFGDFSNTEAIDNALNSDPHQMCRHMMNDRFRCSKGLIAAKILQRADYHELLSIYETRMKPNRITYDRFFAPLVEELNRM